MYTYVFLEVDIQSKSKQSTVNNTGKHPYVVEPSANFHTKLPVTQTLSHFPHESH